MNEENRNHPLETKPGEWATYNVINLPVFAKRIIVELNCVDHLVGHSFDICVEGDVGASWSKNNVTFLANNRVFFPDEIGNLNLSINRVKIKCLSVSLPVNRK